MKTFKTFTSILTVLLICSCSQDEFSIDQLTLKNSEKEAITKFLETSLSATKKSLTKIESSSLEKIDDTYYLISKHSDNKTVTKTLLKVTNDRFLSYAGVSCTSSACAQTSGCVPDGDDRCTSCQTPNYDCTKTVSNNNFSLISEQ